MKKKLLVTLLSFVMVVTMMPLSAFADTNEVTKEETDGPAYGTHEYWEQKYPGHKHVKTIKAGQVFETGTYFIDRDVHITPDLQQSGIVIKGDVVMIIEDNHILKFYGGKTNSTEGAGAGIELTEGNSLHIKGTGQVFAQGEGIYCSDEIQSGGDAGKTTPDDTGKGGKGGNGTGGMGAAIGSKGGEGGLGAVETNGRHDGNIFKDYDGRDGQNGQDGQASLGSGTLKVSGAVQVECLDPSPSYYEQAFPRCGYCGSGYKDGALRTNGVSAGGGCGGRGGESSIIGSGGSGGGGGGAGGSGGIMTHFKRPNGGGGGAGAGCWRPYITLIPKIFFPYGGEAFSKSPDYDHEAAVGESSGILLGGKGGCGAHGGDNPGGDGGNGGNTSPAGNAHRCYSTTPLKTRKTDSIAFLTLDLHSGNAAPVSYAYPVDECTASITGFKDGKPIVEVKHIPTGKVLSEEDYKYDYEWGSSVVTVTISGFDDPWVHGLADETMEHTGQIIVKENIVN